MSVLRYIISFFFILIVSICHSFAEECVLPNDMGSVFTITIPANPPLSTDTGYSQTATLQRSAWIDSKVFTNGDPFYFEIEGSWIPWYGNFESKTDAAGNSLSMKTSDSQFCVLETLNKDVPGKPEVIGIKGEFDYITSAYKVSKYGEESYTKTMLDPFVQKSCWLTAGEGLYLAFFGKSGQELPELATHLKTANIICDEAYKKDRNGDGIITLDECINDKGVNMAYYTPGGARCNSDYFHPNGVREGDGSLKYPLGIFDCYEVYKSSDGKEKRIDKTIFVFRANKLYKNKAKETAPKAEKIKFVIYDKYYNDNIGQYTINMYGGVSDMKDPGLIERILRDLEEIFVGSRDENGVNSGGILKQFYDYVLRDTIFVWSVRMMLVLYMAFLGFQFAMGGLEYKTKELMGILLKLTFVLGFTSINSWQVYDRFVLRFFLDGFSNIIAMIGNISHTMYDKSATATSGISMSSKFAFIDEMITFLFSPAVTKKIQGLFFGVWFGFIVIPIIYILAIYYIYQLVNAIFPYIIMFIQAVLALAVGPIFISFYLFKTTEHLFKNWLAFVGARFINMAFLFLALYAFSAIIRKQFLDLLTFEVCKVSFWQAIASSPDGDVNGAMKFFSFGLKVWDAKWSSSIPQPDFLPYCISLLFIGVLIYLFGIIMKKVPTVVDSMIDIGGESGGGLDRSGNSRFGGKLGGTFDSLNDTFKMRQYDPKTGEKGEKVGVFSLKALRHGANNLLYSTTGYTGGDVKDKIKQGLLSPINSLKDSVASGNIEGDLEANGLRGQELVDAATSQYREHLSEKGYSKNDIDKKMKAYTEDITKRQINDPLLDEFKRVSKSVSEDLKGKPYNEAMVDAMIKARMDDFARRELTSKGSPAGEDYSKVWKNSNLMSSFKEGLNFDKNLKTSDADIAKMAKDGVIRDAMKKYGIKSDPNGDNTKAFANGMWKLIKEKNRENSFTKDAEVERLRKEMKGVLGIDLDVGDMQNKLRDSMKEAAEHRKRAMELLDALGTETDKSKIDEIKKELGELNTADKAVESTITDVMAKAEEIGSVNLVLEGINSNTFGVQGFTGLGLGEDNKDPLGFGSGAGSAVLGADFQPAESDNKGDQTVKLLNENKLRMAQQQKKILAFQIAQAEASGDTMELSRLKEEQKNNEHTIRIIKDDMDED